jgi:hypothetical protein
MTFCASEISHLPVGDQTWASMQRGLWKAVWARAQPHTEQACEKLYESWHNLTQNRPAKSYEPWHNLMQNRPAKSYMSHGTTPCRTGLRKAIWAVAQPHAEQACEKLYERLHLTQNRPAKSYMSRGTTSHRTDNLNTVKTRKMCVCVYVYVYVYVYLHNWKAVPLFITFVTGSRQCTFQSGSMMHWSAEDTKSPATVSILNLGSLTST